ncbi:hypothetical protein [Rhodanobacter umsongensis]
MGYQKPEDVVTPKAAWTLRKVICDTGQGGWALVEGLLLGRSHLAIRWNGDDLTEGGGSPLSTGRPSWFFVPSPFSSMLLEQAERIAKAMTMVTCSLDQPEGFQLGVFLLKVAIHQSALDLLRDKPLYFDIPNFESGRTPIPNLEPPPDDDEYLGQFCGPLSPGDDWRGLIRQGRWQAAVRTRGMEKHLNEVVAAIICDSVTSRVATALAQLL